MAERKRTRRNTLERRCLGKDLKRLFAYSSIAQAGYVLIGILSMGPDGYAAVIFYSLALLVMKFTCFLVLVAMVRVRNEQRRNTERCDLRHRGPAGAADDEVGLRVAARHVVDGAVHRFDDCRR